MTAVSLPHDLSFCRAMTFALCASALCATFVPTEAAAAPAPRPDVERLIEAMEFERIAADLVEGVRQQSDTELAGQMSLGELSAERAERLRTMFGEAYTGERFVESMARSLEERLSGADTSALVALYRTPFGQRQLEAELSHDINADQAGFTAFLQTYRSRPDHAERAALNEAIATTMDLPGAMAGILIDMQVAMVVSLGQSLHAMTPSDLAPVIEQARAQRPALEAQFGQLMPMALDWTYEDMTLAELAAIRDESASPLKRRETAAVIEGLRAGFVNANLAFADALSAHVRVAGTSGEI